MTSTVVKFCAEQTGSCPISCCGPHTCTEELLNHTRRVHECECGHVWGPALAGSAHIVDPRMWSDHIAAHAEKTGTGEKSWQVSWLPGLVDRNQAITALLIADMIALADNGGPAGDLTPGSMRRREIDYFCKELDLKPDDAIRMIRIDQACTSGFVTYSVRDAAGEWPRVQHVRAEHLIVDGNVDSVLAEVIDGDFTELYATDFGVEPGTSLRVQLVDAFGTPAVDYLTPALPSIR